MQGLKTNYILNLLRVVSGAAVGLITMPYINRVLGAENIGKVEYINTVISYFLLFSALGIPMYGLREISKVRFDNLLKARTTLELLIILFITSLIGYLILFGVIYQLDYFYNYRELIIIMSSMIFLTNIGAEWYFQGLEKQLYITIRYIIIRLLMLFFMFMYIKTEADFNVYAACLVLTACGANILNFFVLYKMIMKERKEVFKNINIKRHFKPILTIFIATISVNIYLQLDYLLLGTLTSSEYVGYYSVANKLVRFVISFITIIGVVMLPRLTYLYENDRNLYFNYLHRSFTLLVLISVPFTIYFFVFAEPLIYIIAGNGFDASILTMKIISPLCFIVSMAYFMGFLILYPQNKEKIYTIATIVSALFSIAVNFYAIKHFKQNGAATVGVLSEFIAIVIMFFYLVKNKLLPKIFDRNLGVLFFSNLLLLVIFVLVSNYFDKGILKFLLFSVLFLLTYFMLLILFKEQELRLLIDKYIKRKFIKSNTDSK